MKCAVFAGSFDPWTNGHQEIFNKAKEIFDIVYILIADNSEKKRHYDIKAMQKAIIDATDNDNVIIFDGLVADFCKNNSIKYLIRGLRDTSDYLYEENIAKINKEIYSSLETIYFRAENNTSSTMVRTFLKYNKIIIPYVPASIAKLLLNLN